MYSGGKIPAIAPAASRSAILELTNHAMRSAANRSALSPWPPCGGSPTQDFEIRETSPAEHRRVATATRRATTKADGANRNNQRLQPGHHAAYWLMDPTKAPKARHAMSGTTRIVGLGASAGGLDVLEQFLEAVPANTGLAFVVVQHLDPTYKAMLVELLQRKTAMPVWEAMEGRRVCPDNVYVIAPNTELTISGGALHLAPPSEPRGRRLPIDVLFMSLARELGDQAIGVVLSGMGSDGTLGLQAIRTQGGLTLVQQPESAQFDSMPRSAIQAQCADIIALPAAMPRRILAVMAGYAAAMPLPADVEADSVASIGAILALLREHSKHDLSLYKSSTVKRRIARRMGVHGIATVTDYEEHLRQNPQELEFLFKELLIGVTSFFRDPSLWDELKNNVLPGLLASRPPGSRVRAWVVGCSTGEEAYSLAMVLHEAMDSQPALAQLSLQIFASDISTDAIAYARRGWYPAQIAADVAPDRLKRFFSVEGEGYVINKSLREMVLFAKHDVNLDPPFTKLDILSCRNLLIYFTAKLQNRLLPLFHYCLRTGGILVLGGSETVGRSQSIFRLVDSKSRIYQREDGRNEAVEIDFPTQRIAPRLIAPETKLPETPVQRANLQSLADQVLLQEFAPPAVLVNAGGDIMYICGRTGRYLEPAAGKANWNVHVMLRPEIRMQVIAAMRQAIQDSKTVELSGLRLESEAQHLLTITVRSIREPKALEGLVMIVFREPPPSPSGGTRRRRKPGTAIPASAEEVMRLQDEIQALRQEMTASQEELQATNEELQSTNEELQSANEELTTSKEESQSMNEELQTINNELQAKLDELALAQSDMQNLLNSTDIATLFLDNDLHVRRFTEKITRIIHLRDSDIGRPLSDLASTLIYPQMRDDAKETLRTLAFSEKQIATTDKHWFSVRIMPYRTLTNVIQGAVITFVDITAAKELESHLRKD
jgi:two-component system CheB/CheR fusion protein